MAGWQTAARKKAEWNLKQAEKSEANHKTIATLRAEYEAASLVEDKAMGKR